LPTGGTVFLSVRDKDKEALIEIARELVDLNFKLVATSGTATFLRASGLPVQMVNKVMEGRPNIVDAVINGEIHFIINTTKGPQSYADANSIRRMALSYKIPYYTLLSAARAGVQAMRAMRARAFHIAPLQDYFRSSTDDEDVRKAG
ncbi:MAG: carbamoyl phosphate synthase large subunit, partial [Alphaproteobacteria bacterium]|nr:carbamoyl phosphate synthase large subunit [Alphaproteobacteria bacterium]